MSCLLHRSLIGLIVALLLVACATSATPATPLSLVETTADYRLIRHMKG